MSFVKINLNGVKEPEIAPEGEYDLRIVKVKDDETSKGEPMTTLTIRIEDPEVKNPAPFQHFITYPNGGEYDEMRGLEIKRLLNLFDVGFDEGGFDSDELLGKTARCLVIQEESKKDGVVRNRMKLPRLKE
jgi:hypothetical protein